MARWLPLCVGAAVLWGATSLAGTPGPTPTQPETPLEAATRPAASEAVKDRAAALQILQAIKGTGHIDKERGLWLYGRTALLLRKEWPDGLAQARAAFAELADKGQFEFMRWRGEIGKWDVRLAELCDGLATKKLAGDKFKAEFAALDDEIDRALGRQNERECAVNIAYLLGRVREASGD